VGYTGSDLDGFGEPGALVDSKACIDFGPGDTNQRILIAGSQTRKQLQRLPRNVVQRINPVKGASGDAIGIVLNTHWINGSDEPQSGSVKIKFLPRRGKVKRELQPIFEVVANGFIRVPRVTRGPSSGGGSRVAAPSTSAVSAAGPSPTARHA
jgi:hypothetical protein